MNGLRLRIFVDHALERELELSAPLTIGRAEDNDLMLADESVSSRHARIEKRPDGWFIEDIGSANGSQIAGGPLLREGQSALVSELLQVMVGRTVLELEPCEELGMSSDDAGATGDAGSGPYTPTRRLARLVVLGSGDPRVHELSHSPTVLGRAEDCELQLKLASVSLRHAELRATAEGWSLRDLGSTNGTRVGIVPVAGERLLHSGSHLILGEADLYYLEGEDFEQDEEFARWLARQSQVDAKEARAALDAAQRSGRSLDEVLLRSGVVSPGQLTEWRRQAALEAEESGDAGEGARVRVWMLLGAVIAFGLMAWLAWGA